MVEVADQIVVEIHPVKYETIELESFMADRSQIYKIIHTYCTVRRILT